MLYLLDSWLLTFETIRHKTLSFLNKEWKYEQWDNLWLLLHKHLHHIVLVSTSFSENQLDKHFLFKLVREKEKKEALQTFKYYVTIQQKADMIVVSFW